MNTMKELCMLRFKTAHRQLDGNPPPNEPNTPANANLISKKTYLCQSASQIQRNRY
jgi:hypothetical protein